MSLNKGGLLTEPFKKDIGCWNSDSTIQENSTRKSEPLSLVDRTETSALSVLKFIVSEDIEYARNNDSNVIFKLRKITLIDDGEEIVLGRNKTIQKVYDQLNMLFQIESKKEIRLDPSMPKKCNDALLKLLLNGRPSPKYCCVDFFMDTVGLYSNLTVNNIVGKWEAQKFEETSLNTGDGIIIYNEVEKPVHLAIYLTNGIYLSLFGASGPLIATTLNEMKTGFGGVDAYRLTLVEK